MARPLREVQPLLAAELEGLARNVGDLRREVRASPSAVIPSGWGAYNHTGATQALTANVKASLINDAGGTIHTEKPADIATFYNAGLIVGRSGDSIGFGLELTLTPSSAIASNLYIAIDIGDAVGEIYPRDFAILNGSGVAHRISYNITAYMLNTWEANGGAIKVQCDGPAVINMVRYVVHRLHKA